LDDLTKLFPDTERDKWEKIGLPEGNMGDASNLKDDGKNPASPSSLKHSGGSLKWNKSSSKDVVGYYILKADKKGGQFKTIGHTTDTDFEVAKDGVYKVKAVDYFGLESSASKEVIVGDVDENDEKKDQNKRNNDH